MERNVSVAPKIRGLWMTLLLLLTVCSCITINYGGKKDGGGDSGSGNLPLVSGNVRTNVPGGGHGSATVSGNSGNSGNSGRSSTSGPNIFLSGSIGYAATLCIPRNLYSGRTGYYEIQYSANSRPRRSVTVDSYDNMSGYLVLNVFNNTSGDFFGQFSGTLSATGQGGRYVYKGTFFNYKNNGKIPFTLYE